MQLRPLSNMKAMLIHTHGRALSRLNVDLTLGKKCDGQTLKVADFDRPAERGVTKPVRGICADQPA